MYIFRYLLYKFAALILTAPNTKWLFFNDVKPVEYLIKFGRNSAAGAGPSLCGVILWGNLRFPSTYFLLDYSAMVNAISCNAKAWKLFLEVTDSRLYLYQMMNHHVKWVINYFDKQFSTVKGMET